MVQTITSNIVTEIVTVQYAPEPSQYQQSGAIISVGGTTLATGTYQYCGSLATLTSLLSAAGNYAELTNMATTFFAQGNVVGLYVLELGIQTGADPAVAALETWISDNPGLFYAYLCPADWDETKDEVGSVIITNGGSGYTTAPTVTFSAPTTGTTAEGTAIIQNGVVISVTITNPGSGYTAAPTVTFSAPTTGTTATGTAVLASALNILAGNYSSNTAKTYFVVTTTSTTISNYSAYKSLYCFVASPTAPSSEFGAAADFYNIVVNNPGATNKLQNMAFRFVYGVTGWPQTGYATEINTVLSAFGNLHLTLSQAGITEVGIFKGTVMSGIQFGSWYGIDWYEINANLNIANAIVNGSNQQPPLLYDQNGINSLEIVAQDVANSAVEFGCLQSGTCSATPFYTYVAQNPTNYQAGIYNGLACSATAQVGFLTVGFNINVNFSPS